MPLTTNPVVRPVARFFKRPFWCRQIKFCREFLQTGLGFGHSGGEAVDAAIGMCRSVDVFGMGLFSLGPGHDAVYQHWYDAHFSRDGRCQEHKCFDYGSQPEEVRNKMSQAEQEL